MASSSDDAVLGYELALERAEFARERWRKARRPLTLKQTNGTVGKHPLWQTLLEAETFLLRSRAALKSAERRGRPTGTSSAPDRATKLRVVNE